MFSFLRLLIVAITLAVVAHGEETNGTIHRLELLDSKSYPSWLAIEQRSPFEDERPPHTWNEQGLVLIRNGARVYKAGLKLKLDDEKLLTAAASPIGRFLKGERGLQADFPFAGKHPFVLFTYRDRHYLLTAVKRSNVVQVIEPLVLEDSRETIYVHSTDQFLAVEDKDAYWALLQIHTRLESQQQASEPK